MFAVGDVFTEPGWTHGYLREVVSIDDYLVTIRYFSPNDPSESAQTELTIGFVTSEINSGRWVKV